MSVGFILHPPGRSALFAAVALIMVGCAAPARLDGNKAPTVAVVAGVAEEANMIIAAAVAESLQRQSNQASVSQAQISQKLTNYPQNIQGPYQRAYFEIEVDWERTDMAKIAAIQHALGVDYLYVIWAPTALRNGSLTDYLVWTPADIKAVDIDKVEVPIVVQLFTTPGQRVVVKQQYLVCLDGSKKSSKRFMDGCDSIDSIALTLGKQTGLMKGWW